MNLLLDMEPAEIDLLMWVLHYKNGYSYESISKVVNLPPRKVRYLADKHEEIRFDKLFKFENDHVQYSKDQERLKKPMWKIKMRLGTWNPVSKPIEPDIDSNLQVIEEKRMVLIVKLDNKLKRQKKTIRDKVERVDPDTETEAAIKDVLGKVFG